MSRILLAGAMGAGLLFGSAAIAQTPAPVDQALFDTGQALFEANCVACHQAGGTGLPPVFPALAGNDKLAELALIVGNVHEGKGAMPAFANLGAADIAALATYVRNAWGNNFGGVTEAEVEAALAAL